MGFPLPSCPSFSAASSGLEHTDPTHKVGLCEAGFSPFPWACGRNLELLDTIVIQEMRPRQCEVSSPDVSLRFLEPCIRTQTSTSWTIRSAQWMQESAGTCLNSEFAPVFYHVCFPGTLWRSGKRAQESLCAPGDSAHSVLVSLPSLHRRSIIEKFCIMMRSGQENTAVASSVCRTVGSML